jgi:hypothetical protein
MITVASIDLCGIYGGPLILILSPRPLDPLNYASFPAFIWRALASPKNYCHVQMLVGEFQRILDTKSVL